MVWSPNYAGGYPYTGGAYSAKPGTAAWQALDTDHSGTLTMADDPYAPYYPGDAYVDWVGLTVYHFGSAWPYGENEVPVTGKFLGALRGTWNGGGVEEDQSAVPDFYGTYAEQHGKPLAISETGALYAQTPPVPGASQLDVKSAWLEQVMGASTRAALPRMKMVNWFEVKKYETETHSVVDWRVSADPAVRALLLGHLRTGWVWAPAR
jgi:hypothetical protein